MPLMTLPMMEPASVTDAIMFLCGPSGRYITGVALPIDAGQQLR